jgi:hypothetical protein
MLQSMCTLGLAVPVSTHDINSCYDGYFADCTDRAAIASGWHGVLSHALVFITTSEMRCKWHQRSISIPLGLQGAFLGEMTGIPGGALIGGLIFGGLGIFMSRQSKEASACSEGGLCITNQGQVNTC